MLSCCECGEVKDSEQLLAAHISIEHLVWLPYSCVYCLTAGCGTRKTSEQELREHLKQRHPTEQVSILFTPDEHKQKLLRDKIELSKELWNKTVEQTENEAVAGRKIKLEIMAEGDGEDDDDFVPDSPVNTPKTPQVSILTDFAHASPVSQTRKTNSTPPKKYSHYCVTCKHEYGDVHKHLRSKHFSAPIFTCSKCLYKSSFSYDVKKHIEKVHRHRAEIQRIRSKDDVDTEIERLKRIHLARDGTHHGAKRAKPKFLFRCKECNMGLSNVQYHIFKYHLKTEALACPVCGWGTYNLQQQKVREHIKSQHPYCLLDPVNHHPKYIEQVEQVKRTVIVKMK